VQNSLFPPEADLTPIISGVAHKNPDILAVGGHDTVLIDVVKACRSAKWTPKAIIMHYGVTEPSFAKELGQDAEGVFGITDWVPEFDYQDDVFGTASEFAAAYKAKPPGLSDDDKTKFNQIIGQTDLKTFYGQVKFDASGDHFHDNSQPPPVLIQIKQGKVVAVKPDDVKQGEFQYPMKSLT
jgi:branched-chain amino acid transport system substrate-binding protein